MFSELKFISRNCQKKVRIVRENVAITFLILFIQWQKQAFIDSSVMPEEQKKLSCSYVKERFIWPRKKCKKYIFFYMQKMTKTL